MQAFSHGLRRVGLEGSSVESEGVGRFFLLASAVRGRATSWGRCMDGCREMSSRPSSYSSNLCTTASTSLMDANQV